MGKMVYGLYVVVVQNIRDKLYKRDTTTGTAHLQGPRHPSGGPMTPCEIKQRNDTSGCHTFHPFSGALCIVAINIRVTNRHKLNGEQGTHNIRGSNLFQPLFDLTAEPLNVLVINLRRDINRLVTRKYSQVCLLSSQEVFVAACVKVFIWGGDQ